MAIAPDRFEVPWAEVLGGGQLDRVNLVLFGGSNQSSRLARLVFLVLAGATDAQGRPAFGRAIVILPPDVPDTVAADVEADVAKIRADSMDAEELEILARRLEVRRMATFETEAVLQAVEQAPEGSFVIIVGAARYRPINARPPPPSSLQAPEDRWLPWVIDLANQCGPGVADSKFVLIDVGEFSPVLQRNLDALQAVDGSVWGADAPPSLDDERLRQLQAWVRRVERGDILSVLGEIDGNPGWSAPVKLLTKAQVLHRGGRTVRAMEFVRAYLPHLDAAAADLKLKLATIALGADDLELARHLIETSAEELTELDLNELALELTESVPSPVIEAQCQAWLTANFPTSATLREHQLRALLRAARDGDLDDLAHAPLPLDEYVSVVRAGLRGDGVPDYPALVEQVDRRWPKFEAETRLAATLDARRRDLPMHVAMLAPTMDPQVALTRPATHALLWSIERLLLIGDEGAREVLADAVLFMLLYLARHPGDTASRERLDELLSIEVAGSVGVALLAIALLRLAAAPQPEPLRRVADEDPDEDFADDQFMALYGRATEWLSRQRMVDLSSVALPDELVTMPADAALEFLKRMVQHVIAQEQADDGPTLRLMVLVSFALAPHAERRNDDLEILRLAVSRLVVAGEAQLARDLVEAGLTATQGRTDRLRLAWCAYGDAFHRMHNVSRALMAFGCALATEGTIELDHAYYETMGVVRALRDAGLWEPARKFLDRCEDLMREMGAYERRGHRIETMRLGIAMAELLARQARDPAAWSDLLASIDANLAAVRRENDELATVLVMAVQVMRHVEEGGGQVDAATRLRIDDALTAAGANTAELVQLAANVAVGPDRLLERAQAAQGARYADDVGFDVQFVVRAARAQLADDATLADPSAAAFAAELTTDHAIASPGTVQGNWLPSALDEPVKALEALSRRGVPIELLAIDNQDRLVRVRADAGEITVRREHEAFSVTALHAWSRRFPYAYADAEPNEARRERRNNGPDPNMFYNSMHGLGLSVGAGEQAVFVLDIRLQRLPPQLLLVEDELLGRTTAVAVAPSLTWLQASTAAPPRAYGAPAAWISTAVEGEGNGTLATVADRATAVLERHGVALQTSAEIPEHLQGAQLAIVAAHGGLGEENRFFKVISDEAQLRLSGPALARSLEGAAVVVLFVCSGGRQDEHPVASTSVGLPKQLLDRGSSAVIASPWPLDSRVPSHWLPAFLAAWDAGQTLIEANAAGNRVVSAQMGGEPRDAMALTLYGNAFLRKNDVQGR